jgi:hypothetical protein
VESEHGAFLTSKKHSERAERVEEVGNPVWRSKLRSKLARSPEALEFAFGGPRSVSLDVRARRRSTHPGQLRLDACLQGRASASVAFRWQELPSSEGWVRAACSQRSVTLWIARWRGRAKGTAPWTSVLVRLPSLNACLRLAAAVRLRPVERRRLTKADPGIFLRERPV